MSAELEAKPIIRRKIISLDERIKMINKKIKPHKRREIDAINAEIKLRIDNQQRAVNEGLNKWIKQRDKQEVKYCDNINATNAETIKRINDNARSVNEGLNKFIEYVRAKEFDYDYDFKYKVMGQRTYL